MASGLIVPRLCHGMDRTDNVAETVIATIINAEITTRCFTGREDDETEFMLGLPLTADEYARDEHCLSVIGTGICEYLTCWGPGLLRLGAVVG